MIKEKLTLAGVTGLEDTIGNLCNNRQSVMAVQKRIRSNQEIRVRLKKLI